MTDSFENISQTTEIPYGFGTIEVDTADALVCRFHVLEENGDERVIEKVVERDLVSLSNHPDLPGGIVMWYLEQFSIDGEVVVAVDKYYAKI